MVGQRFVCDFKVVSVDGPPYTEDSVVAIYLHGERCEITLGELSTLIETGFVMEIPERRT